MRYDSLEVPPGIRGAPGPSHSLRDLREACLLRAPRRRLLGKPTELLKGREGRRIDRLSSQVLRHEETHDRRGEQLPTKGLSIAKRRRASTPEILLGWRVLAEGCQEARPKKGK